MELGLEVENRGADAGCIFGGLFWESCFLRAVLGLANKRRGALGHRKLSVEKAGKKKDRNVS